MFQLHLSDLMEQLEKDSVPVIRVMVVGGVLWEI